ncbi:MAG: DUF262 domain-containing protein [Spirochaetaceae bacterium]|nr:DUF262 domain-containing protein [Spirochaetaceae bacterium]
MNNITTIANLLTNTIAVPNYQRAYAWREWRDKGQLSQFIEDLEEHYKAITTAGLTTPYHFGHFLFEKNEDDNFYVIDGQQRLTTIVIFLAATSANLNNYNINLNKFSTIGYDNQFFIDYVMNKTKTNKDNLPTKSSQRIANAFDYFNKRLPYKVQEHIEALVDIVLKASCTTAQLVQNSMQAAQMFIFQNDRGLKVTILEKIKAQFMHKLHLFGSGQAAENINKLQQHFENIYKAQAIINIDEDTVLGWFARVWYGKLTPTINVHEEIMQTFNNEKFQGTKGVDFILRFCEQLEKCFNNLIYFYRDDSLNFPNIRSLIILEDESYLFMPFIIKAYNFNLPKADIDTLCNNFMALEVRRRLIGGKGYLHQRLGDVFNKFNDNSNDISPITDRIEVLKTMRSGQKIEINEFKIAGDYWNNTKIKEALEESVEDKEKVIKFILWQYETNNGDKCNYDYDELSLDYIRAKPGKNYTKFDLLGNYILLTPRNTVKGDSSFDKKKSSFIHLKQQLEIRDDHQLEVWDSEAIEKRHKKLVQFVLENL